MFYRAEGVPVSIGSLWNTHHEAVNCSKGDITLAVCHDCGLITNQAFDPDLLDYQQAYDNSLDCSEVFREYAQSLADHLIRTFNLHGKTIIEIGCGNGQFLNLLCELGDNTGVGYDPSYVPANDATACSPSVRIEPRTFTGQNGDDPIDFICCRQVLEHISDPSSFLASVRRATGKRDTGLYFEVPNMMHALRSCSIGTIIYEHCAYYCSTSLAHIFRAAGFDVREVSEDFDGQFLGIDAYSGTLEKPDGTAQLDSASVREIVDAVDKFQRTWAKKLQSLLGTLSSQRARQSPAVVWGAGARAVSILNTLDEPSLIHCAIDINPNKRGKFIAGTGHPIQAPEDLRQIRPGTVIIMNEIYADEISQALHALGLQCELVIA